MRKIQSPGVEINEIDRSNYDINSIELLTDTATLLMGFTDKGKDFETKYINNINNFVAYYGYPTNEEERYMYYAAQEVIKQRGILYTAKLPYYNDTFKKYSYTTYVLDGEVHELVSTYDRMLTDLENKNFTVGGQIQKGNNVLSVLLLNKLDNSGCDVLNSTMDIANGLNYSFINDILDQIFINAHIQYYSKNTFDQIFKNYKGLRRFEELLETKGKTLSGLSYSEEIEYYMEDDLIHIRDIVLKKWPNTANGPSSYEQAIDSYVKKLTIGKFLDYYENLSVIVSPIFDDIKGKFDTNFGKYSNHWWKVDFANLSNYYNTGWFNSHYSDIRTLDSSLSSYGEIKHSSSPTATGMMSYDDYDRLLTNEFAVAKNTIRIVDISRAQYDKNDDADLEFLGIMPVVTTAANAMYCQKMISDSHIMNDYNVISRIRAVQSKKPQNSNVSALNIDDENGYNKYYDLQSNEYLFAQELSANETRSSISDIAGSYFPALTYTSSGKLYKNYMKQIGIVVFKLIRDKSNSNKVGMVPVESFVGGMCRDSKDLGKTTINFIDNIVNSRSNYINVFSNIDSSASSVYSNSSIMLIHNQTATSLGFYSSDCYKNIHLSESILKPIQYVFDDNNHIDKRNIDLVVDAGVSTIAQYIGGTKMLDFNMRQRQGYFDLFSEEGRIFSIEDTSPWRSVINLYDTFCKITRKDCMFIADSPRPFCLQGNEKIVRTSKPTNTVEKDILPNLKNIININTSYGAGYSNWFYSYDNYSGLYFWCPPSIKALGSYLYSDTYFNSWSAPAGLTRGRVSDVYDIAFSPTVDEAGKLYNNAWNYALQYPTEGIVIEGQKTFQLNKTALDRVNVRRMLLRLEKLVYRIAKKYCYEGNTPIMRQRFVDTIRPIFENAKLGGGISDYYIICNDKNNTATTIDNNELHCTIAVRPVKVAEFIILNFIALPQSGSFSEEEILSMT